MEATKSVQSLAPVRSIHWTIALLLVPQLALAMLWMGVLQVLLPTQVAAIDPAHKVEHLGLITGIAALVVAVCNPLAGALSDRTRTRWGRRTPWLLGASAATVLALVLQGQVNGVAALAIAFCLVQCASGAFQAVMTAVMPERVPVHRRGLASSVIGIGLPLGAVAGSALAARFVADLPMGYLMLAACLLLSAVIFVAAETDPVALGAPVQRGSVALSRTLLSFFSVLSANDFRWTFISRFLCLMAFSLPSGFSLYLLQDYIKLDAGHTPAALLVTLNIVQMGCMTLSTLIGGPLSDWLGGRRRIFVWCSALGMAAALVLPLLMPTEAGMLAFCACNGLSFGVYLAVDAALVTQVLPDQNNVARDLGILNIANCGPQILAPFVGAQVIALFGGYRAMFVAAALCALASALAIFRVRNVR